MDRRHVFAAALVACGLVAYAIEHRPAPAPTPEPTPALLNLRGKAIGPTASADLTTFSALCEEIAACLEWDGSQPEEQRRIKTGAALEDLRVAAREARCRGVSLGAKQPHIRDAVKKFLDEAAGTSGDSLTPEERSLWVNAFREVGRAAADAAK
jgi:hypothetical protein